MSCGEQGRKSEYTDNIYLDFVHEKETFPKTVADKMFTFSARSHLFSSLSLDELFLFWRKFCDSVRRTNTEWRLEYKICERAYIYWIRIYLQCQIE